MKLATLGLALVAVLATGGCVEETEAEDDAAVEALEESGDALAGFAVPDTGDPAVVGIRLTSSLGQTMLCTGELVAPRVVLTAAHCLQGIRASTVFVGLTWELRTQAVSAVSHIPHPNYNPTKTGLDLADIGAIVLARPLNVKPIVLNRKRLETYPNIEGRTVKLVGYGVTSRSFPSTAGTKRRGTGKIEDVIKTELSVRGDAPLSAVACGGDSGGPTLLSTPAGWVLIGVESRGDAACKIGTIKTRVDTYLPFIDGIIAKYR